MTADDLQELAVQHGLNGDATQRREDIVRRVLENQTDRNAGVLMAQGVLEILPDGWGFLRRSNFSPNSEDIYVSQTQIKRFVLKTGDMVNGQVRPPKDSEKFYGLLRVEAVNGLDPEVARNRIIQMSALFLRRYRVNWQADLSI
jgi:transcription termination factor Rho